MKKRLFSLWLVLNIGFSTIFPCAAEISFEEINIDSIAIDFPIKATENNFTEYGDTQNNYFSDSPIEATEKIYIDNKVSSINLLSDNNDTDLPDIIVPENLSYTTVDLTDLATGDIITHDCNMYLVTNFDEDNHWNECSICGKILNLEEHNYEDAGWTGGSANNCSNSNYHLFICECGASYNNINGKSDHTWTTFNYTENFEYRYLCSKCSAQQKIHLCVKSNGSRINCTNPGTCSLCKHTYTAFHCGEDLHEPGAFYCTICNKYLGNVNTINYTYNGIGNVNMNYSVSINGSYSSLTNTGLYSFCFSNKLWRFIWICACCF